jgi:hypothetical protein
MLEREEEGGGGNMIITSLNIINQKLDQTTAKEEKKLKS